MAIFIFGHKNPDTDSVVSAIVYARFLNSMGIKATAVCLNSINKETEFILKNLKIKFPEIVKSLEKDSKVILVDHNENSQTIESINELKIEEIIDHHKFNFNAPYPINIRAERLGSTCSIIYKILRERNYKFSKEETILLISGIISDTLFFRSPTSTQEDKEIANELNKVAKIKNLEEYALQMFKEKSNVSHLEAKELIKLDYKEYEFKGKKYGVGVIETTNPEDILKRKEEIVKSLEIIKKEEGAEGILVSVIDILKEHNHTIISAEHEAEILAAVFGGKKVEHNLYSLGPIISRKKQIIPKLEEHFNS